ncbi:MAG: thiol-disulfide oxidoreductase DCC family protein [Acidimicrobiales bacterium]
MNEAALDPVAGAAPVEVVGAPAGITVFYDAGCALCRRCRAWLESQRTWVPVRFAVASATEAQELLPDVPWLGTELVVIGDDGATWVGPAAFLTCLWATVRYRSWSRRLAGPAFAPMAERFFHLVSDNRAWLNRTGGVDACEDGTCRHRHDPSWPGRR